MNDRNRINHTNANSNDNPPIIITQTTLGSGNTKPSGGNQK